MQSIDLLIKNASEIVMVESNGPVVGTEFSAPLTITQGDIAVNQGKILNIGNLSNTYDPLSILDAFGMTVFPGFVDPHTHLVHYGSRHLEFGRKMQGQSYADLHDGGGGILYTVKKTRAASSEQLLQKSLHDLDLMLLHGTTTIEAKSGYGLTIIDEKRILEVIAEARTAHPITIIPTFLGAHTVPLEYSSNREGYVALVKEMIPRIRPLATSIDVFCDPKGFTVEETKEIIHCGRRNGLLVRLHIDQTDNNLGGELAVHEHAVSVSHADYTSFASLRALAQRKTMVELLPGVTYHQAEFMVKDFWKERVNIMKEMDVPLCLATDYNPGSSRIASMPAIMQHAARFYGLTPEEDIRAGTINSARSLGLDHDRGSITVGKNADLVVVALEHYQELIDFSGTNVVKHVIKDGKVVVRSGQLVYR